MDISIDLVGLCDEITEAQFGKLNLLGLNRTDNLTINDVPYRLLSNLIVLGEIPIKWPEATLCLEFEFIDSKHNKLLERKMDFHLPDTLSNNARRHFVLHIPLDLTLPDYGTANIRISSGEGQIKLKKFSLIKGDAPHIAVSTRVDSSSLITSTESSALDSILGSANKTLVLIDKYLAPKGLRHLLEYLPTTTSVRVLTALQNKEKYKRDVKQFGQFNRKVEIRFTDAIHDRFIIVNETEYFHFGHSFIPLSKGQISRYSKVISKNEISDLREIYNELWAKAQTL